jgi:hypothetical protein
VTFYDKTHENAPSTHSNAGDTLPGTIEPAICVITLHFKMDHFEIETESMWFYYISKIHPQLQYFNFNYSDICNDEKVSQYFQVNLAMFKKV